MFGEALLNLLIHFEQDIDYNNNNNILLCAHDMLSDDNLIF